MTRPIRFALLAILSVSAVVAATVPFLLPPRAEVVPTPVWASVVPTVRGAYHVHSTISDGTGTLDEIAAAAAAAGLQFVIVTDHGDGTRQAEPVAYRSGVLVIEGVEINTDAGHLVALGMQPSPFPLAGTARAVLEDVHRLGGIGIAAHPGSPRESLQWTDWSVPLDGLEWLNADSEWRDELLHSLGRMVLTYPLRPAETLTSMLNRPDSVIARWDEQQRTAKTIGLAGADAHARLGFRRELSDPYEDRWHLAVPAYESSFRAFTTRVTLDGPLTGEAADDAARILRGIGAGRVYTVVDGIGSPGAFDFRATSGGVEARMGDDLDRAGDTTFHIRAAAPAGSRMMLLRDGEPYFDTMETEARIDARAPDGVYRVEIYAPAHSGPSSIPWLVSNPIHVGMRAIRERAAAGSLRPLSGERGGIATEQWTSEASEGSTSRLEGGASVEGIPALEWQFGLQGGTPSGQYAALRFPIAGGLAGRDRVQVRARADRPMRVWVQLRASSLGGDRWGHSVYLGQELAMSDLFFEDFVPMGEASSERPPLALIDSLLLVADTVNTRPGSQGVVQIVETWVASPSR